MTEARLIDGKAKAAKLSESVKTETAALVGDGLRPGLAVIIVGEDPEIGRAHV